MSRGDPPSFGPPSFGREAQRLVAELTGGDTPEAMEVVFNLIRAANRIAQDLEARVYRPAGVSSSGFNALFALSALGPQTPQRLSQLASISAPSMTSLLKTLETRGLIQRGSSPEDRRSVLIDLTPSGKTLVEELVPQTHSAAGGWSALFTHEERETLTAFLTRLVTHHPNSDGA